MNLPQTEPAPRMPSQGQVVLTRIVRRLNDSVLGFLALLAAEFALAPVILELPPGAARLLEVLQWWVVIVFGIEYFCSLLLSKDRLRFAADPWRLLDLFIIVVPLISLVPSVSNALRSTPILRLLRLLRLASFAARVSGSVVREQGGRQSSGSGAPPEICLLRPHENLKPESGTWDDFVRWLKSPEGNWCHLSNVTPAQFDTMTRLEGLSRPLLESCLSEANYPRLEVARRSIVLTVWLPAPRSAVSKSYDRSSVLLVAAPSALLTVAPRATNLPQVLSERLQNDSLPSTPLSVRLILGLLRLVLDRHEEAAGQIEQHLRALEDVPVGESRPIFFEESFRSRKELSAIKSDLWRVKGILAALADGRVRLPGSAKSDHAEPGETLRVLCDRADYLYQTADNLREGVLSVIELHLNVVSFEINKFMRLLAVVSVLGLIPAVVGGLLGMNLTGNPWPATLSEVTFGVCAAVLLVLYAFLVRGWLR